MRRRWYSSPLGFALWHCFGPWLFSRNPVSLANLAMTCRALHNILGLKTWSKMVPKEFLKSTPSDIPVYRCILSRPLGLCCMCRSKVSRVGTYEVNLNRFLALTHPLHPLICTGHPMPPQFNPITVNWQNMGFIPREVYKNAPMYKQANEQDFMLESEVHAIVKAYKATAPKHFTSKMTCIQRKCLLLRELDNMHVRETRTPLQLGRVYRDYIEGKLFWMSPADAARAITEWLYIVEWTNVESLCKIRKLACFYVGYMDTLCGAVDKITRSEKFKFPDVWPWMVGDGIVPQVADVFSFMK